METSRLLFKPKPLVKTSEVDLGHCTAGEKGEWGEEASLLYANEASSQKDWKLSPPGKNLQSPNSGEGRHREE